MKISWMLRTACLLVATWLAPSPAVSAQSTHTVVDLAGRSVTLPIHIDRILLGEGRLLPVLGILDREDPAQRLVAMMGDYETLDPAGYAQWRNAFPHLDQVMRVGRIDSASFSDEQAIANGPQLAILGLSSGHGPNQTNQEVIHRLQAAGMAVLFVDFRQDPLTNTTVSMELLGKVLGREDRAQAFVAEWRAQMALVTERLSGSNAPAQRPSVFLDNRVGLSDECCSTMVGLVGVLLEAAGGKNIARGLIPGQHGVLNPELLLAEQPDFYIGTAIGNLATAEQTPLRIVLGPDATEEAARSSLQRATERRYISQLRAVHEGRAFAVWHHFYNSPLNVAAIQAMAKWLYPERFQDLDPQATLEGFYQRHLPIPYQGLYWIGQ